MLTGLDNKHELASTIVTQGPAQNIWFVPVSINRSTET
jgi:hypothetical protein